MDEHADESWTIMVWDGHWSIAMNRFYIFVEDDDLGMTWFHQLIDLTLHRSVRLWWSKTVLSNARWLVPRWFQNVSKDLPVSCSFPLNTVMPISALLGGIWDKWGLCSVSHKKIIIRINIQCGTLYTDQYTRLFWFTSLPCLLLFLTSGCRETCRTPPYLAGTIHGFHWFFSHLNPSEPIWSIMEVSCPDRPSGLSFGPLLDAPRATGCYGSRIEAMNPPKTEFFFFCVYVKPASCHAEKNH